MKSCQCSQCNVSSARFAWGFALLARDGWGVAPASDLLSVTDRAWVCPACHRKAETALPSSTRLQALKRACNSRFRPSGKLRILLVDDEEIVRRCTVRMLGGFDVVSVGSGSEALKQLRSDSDFDVVLSDVMMPGMTGPDLYAACYGSFPSLAERFVFASGNVDAARSQLERAVDSVQGQQTPILLAKPTPRDALLLALYAAAAHDVGQSGTYSTVEPVRAEVSKYRG